MTKSAVVASPEPYETGAAVPWNPQVSAVMTGVFETPAKKRKALLEAIGKRKSRKKYKSPAARKAAAKKRRKARKAERADIFEQFGVKPREKGKKMTEAQKKAKRSERGKKRRELFREMARSNPELAKKYGIDVSKFKK